MSTHYLAFAPRWKQWLTLLLLSSAILVPLELVHLPAALMFGPMFAGMAIGLFRGTIRVPSPLFKAAQCIIGCMIALSVTPQVIEEFLNHWVLLICIILAAVACTSLIGIVLTRQHVMPGSTAIWGTTPGAASAMVVIAESYGADIRLVAFMQYFRVLLVTLTATLIAWFITPTSPDNGTVVAPGLITQWFPEIEPIALISTLAVAAIGITLASWLRIPASGMIGPIVLGGILHGLGWIDMQLPQWLLAMSFFVIGWKIGLTFDFNALRHISKALPAVTLSVLALMGFCGLLSCLLAVTLDLDPLTAYLANTPGGLEAVAVIAASRPETNLSFIMMLQTVRLLVLTIVCPPLTQWLAKRYQDSSA